MALASSESLLSVVRGREVDREFLSPAQLNVEKRQSTSAFQWRGQFTPGLADLMLDTYDPGTGIVLDPFVGSGTTLIAAARRARPSIGIEVNPAAHMLSRTLELAACSVSERSQILQTTESIVEEIAASESAVSQLASRATSDAPESRLLAAVLLLALRNGASASSERIWAGWHQVAAAVGRMPGDPVACEAVLGDARAIPLNDKTVGFTLTSPPYINVFNYHQNYRPATELLGADVLAAARSEIGSNRKHRQNRFLTVIQYAQDMAMAMRELVRVSMNDARLVLVVGRESRVRGVPFPNGELLSAVIEAVGGFAFERWQERHFTSRFGERIFEEVLTFRATGEGVTNVDAEELGRTVGVELLTEALASTTDPEVRIDIENAILGASGVHVSPIANAARVPIPDTIAS